MSRALALLPATVGGIIGVWIICPELAYLLAYSLTAGGVMALVAARHGAR